MSAPRTCRLDLATPPEVALREALRAVEAMPADVRLTHAGQKIVEALDLVGDFVNEQLHDVDLGDPTGDATAYRAAAPIHVGRRAGPAGSPAMTTRDQALAFLRGLKLGGYGVTMTIYQDVVDHVLAALDEATARGDALLAQSAQWEGTALERGAVMLKVAGELRARDRGTQRGLRWAYDAAGQLERTMGVDTRVAARPPGQTSGFACDKCGDDDPSTRRTARDGQWLCLTCAGGSSQ